jgi:endonuclease YncB( thermonuclease family)
MRDRPPHGVCLPVSYVSSRDGDTILVSLGSDGGGLVWPIRLDSIDCPEKRDPGGFEAHDYVIALLTDADLSVWVASPKRKNILRSLSFDRIIGDLFIEGKGWLTDILVEAGHATRV